MPQPPQTTANFASRLSCMAHIQPHALALLAPAGYDRRGRASYTHYTFGQLDAESNAVAGALIKAGIGPGVRTVFMLKPGLDFLTFAFALFKIGAVLVGVDPGIGPRNIATCLSEVAPTAFIGVPLAHFFRRVMGWSRKTIRVNIHVGRKAWSIDRFLLAERRRFPDPATAAEFPAAVSRDSLAAIVFTSGSTGVPKGVIYTHETFHAQVDTLQATYGIGRGETDLTTFAHFSFHTIALGLTTVLADMDFTRPARADPRKIVEAIQSFGVTNLFVSPALLNVLGRYGQQTRVKLPSMKRVISAGAPVSTPAIRQVAQMLGPEAQVFTPYGATEVLPVSSIGSNELLADTCLLTERGRGVCVGVPCRDLEVRIIKISDQPIEKWSDDLCAISGECGEIVVRGPGVSREYYNRPQSNALAKIQAGDRGFFHRMGDLGYFDNQGRLWFCGRKSQRVKADSGVHFTVPCEFVFNAHPSVFRSALVPVSIAGKIQPALCVQLEKHVKRHDRKRIREELLQLGNRYPQIRDIRNILFCSSFPVDARHNAKINRERLSEVAQRRLA